MKIKDSVVLITGADGGLGSALVGELIERGARRIYAGGLRAERLESVVALAPTKITALTLDITDDNDVAAAAGAAADINLLINAAGVMGFGGPLDGDPTHFERDMKVNYLGPLRMARAFAPALSASGGGAILNVESILALAPMPALAGYCASKAAAHALTIALRAQLSQQQVTVHSLLPGPIDTDMVAALDWPKTSPREVARAALDGLEAGDEIILPDAFATESYKMWSTDPIALEHLFAAL